MITLEPMDHKHSDKVVQWRSEFRIYDAFFKHSVPSLGNQAEWLREHSGRPNEKNFIIVLSEAVEGYPVIASDYIGAISLYDIDYENRKAEFGRFYIGEESKLRKGYAREALKMVLNYAFKDLELNKVYLETYEGNLATKLYKDAGFVDEAILKKHILRKDKFIDVMRMCIFKEDYNGD